MKPSKWPLPANRLVSDFPQCKTCRANIETFDNPCPYCGATDPLVKASSIGWALVMLAGEAAVVWLIFRACRS